VARAAAEHAKAEAQKAKAEAAKAQADFQRARAEAASRMFGAETKRISHPGAREQLVKALQMLASGSVAERARAATIVETQRARIDMAWDELIVPAELEQSKAA
jgi:phage gp16-like protein